VTLLGDAHLFNSVSIFAVLEGASSLSKLLA
jgi:hypothetical protein